MLGTKQIAAIGLCLLIAVWLTWPTVGQVNANHCSPAGAIARVSELIHGRSFWIAQLQDISARRYQAENWDVLQAERDTRLNKIMRDADDAIQKSYDSLETLYQKYPQLAASESEKLTPSESQKAAQRLRQLAAQIEDAEMKRRLSDHKKVEAATLRNCESIIHNTLK